MPGTELTAESLARRLPQGRWNGRQGHACCPAHADTDPSFAFAYGREGRLIFKCHAGCEFRDVARALRDLGFDVGRSRSAPDFHGGQRQDQRRSRRAPEGNLRWSPRAQTIWDSAVPLDQARVPYFRVRGIAEPRGEDVRFLSAKEHWPSRTTWPCIVSRVTDFATGEPLTLHFTFLSVDAGAKAPVPVGKAKLLLRDHVKAGGVIRLTDDADVTGRLGLAEGLETALAITAAQGSLWYWFPTWATVDSGNMGALPVVPGIGELNIYADVDPSGTGEKAARKLAARWHAAGVNVAIVLPPAAPGGKADWNDWGTP